MRTRIVSLLFCSFALTIVIGALPLANKKSYAETQSGINDLVITGKISEDKKVSQMHLGFTADTVLECKFDITEKPFTEMTHTFEITKKEASGKNHYTAMYTVLGDQSGKKHEFFIRCDSDVDNLTKGTHTFPTPTPIPTLTPKPTATPSSGGGGGGGGGGGTSCLQPRYDAIAPIKNSVNPVLTKISFLTSPETDSTSIKVSLNQRIIEHTATKIEFGWLVTATVPQDTVKKGDNLVTLFSYIQDKCPRNLIYTVEVEAKASAEDIASLSAESQSPSPSPSPLVQEKPIASPTSSTAGNATPGSLFEEKLQIDFADLKGHWAETFVKTLVEKEIISGYGDGSFGPNNPLTRAEAVKIALNTFEYDVPQKVIQKPYKDVEISAWYAIFVQAGKTANIINGFADETFRPNEEVSRAEALKIIAIAAGAEPKKQDESTPDFTDVSFDAWYADYVEWARDNKIIDGFADGTFRPNASITRAEFAKITYEILHSSYSPDAA